jgi:hypothetical protein
MDGEIIPPAVAAELERVLGLQFRTSRDGVAEFIKIPDGVYEFWPYSSEDELANLSQTLSQEPAPIVVKVSSGQNDVTVHLQSKN